MVREEAETELVTVTSVRTTRGLVTALTVLFFPLYKSATYDF